MLYYNSFVKTADMAELADALDLGSSVPRRAGSSPVIRILKPLSIQGFFCVTFRVA